MMRQAVLLALVVAACSPVEMRSQIDRPAGENFASTGDVVLRVQRAENLPNAFGRSDIFGRTRDRGFTELRFMGVGPTGAAIFRRQDVSIITNETTMSRSPGFSTYQAQGSASQRGYVGSAQFQAQGTSFTPAGSNVAALPPDTVEFSLDLSQSRIVTVGQNGIEIIQALASGIKYRAY